MTCKDGRFNTGNKLCSNDLRDLNDNSIIVDGYVNSQELYIEDRLGVERLTLAGIQNKSDKQYDDIQERADTQNAAITDRADSTISKFGGEIDAIIKDAGGVEVVGEFGDSPEKVISQKKISEHLGQDSDGNTVIKRGSDVFTLPSEGGELVAVKDLGTVKPYILASDFGFHVSNTAEVNSKAVVDAVSYAKGRKVVVEVPTDFYQGNTVLNGLDVVLEYHGSGKWLNPSGGMLLSFGKNWDAIQAVSDIRHTTLKLEGRLSDVVRVTATNSRAYVRGDVVKVYSTDLDERATKEGRRVGEFATVVHVTDSYIYLAGKLHDLERYVTSVHIAKMQKGKFKLKLTEIVSTLNTRESILNVSCAYMPELHFSCVNHGWIMINSGSSYMGKYYLYGEGKGDSDGNLGYLFNDASGYRNTFYSPVGKFLRHITTTAFNTATNVNSPNNFGATRYHTVIDGSAIAPAGAPWDEHAGSHDSVWINCFCGSPSNSAAAYNCAFQLRGVGGQINEPTVERGYQASIRRSVVSYGNVNVVGGKFYSPIYAYNGDRKLAITFSGSEIYVTSRYGILRGTQSEELNNAIVNINNANVTYNENLNSTHIDFVRMTSGNIVNVKNTTINIGYFRENYELRLSLFTGTGNIITGGLTVYKEDAGGTLNISSSSEGTEGETYMKILCCGNAWGSIISRNTKPEGGTNAFAIVKHFGYDQSNNYFGFHEDQSDIITRRMGWW